MLFLLFLKTLATHLMPLFIIPILALLLIHPFTNMPSTCFAMEKNQSPSPKEKEELFETISNSEWKSAFHDPGTSDWEKMWFLDGKKATIQNSDKGLLFSAGPWTTPPDESHSVLWTHQSFEGDLKIEYTFTRNDSKERGVVILYLLATGIGDQGFDKDISKWNDKRTIPYMKTYYYYMNLFHISYATPAMPRNDNKDYVRARRYPVTPGSDFKQFASATDLKPDYFDTNLFQEGVPHKITVVKTKDHLMMKVQNKTISKIFAWEISSPPSIDEGRIGLRQMAGRSSTYKDFRVYVRK